MQKVRRREFLQKIAVAGLGIITIDGAWALEKLEPTNNNPLKDFSYRGWEDLYRQERTWDTIGYSAHCSNCIGNCAFKIFVKDGVVLREEQLAQYPRIGAVVPDANPRGCQKGAIHSQAMYEGDRLRYPMKRIGQRGEGKWQRISWEQASVEIADKIIDIYEKDGPGYLSVNAGTGVLSQVRFAAPRRMATLLGATEQDFVTDVGDLNTGAHVAYGDVMQSFTSDSWFDADYIMMTVINPNVTRIPDAHFIWEAKHRGARVVSIAPDYNPSSIHADVWINIRSGTDPFFNLSMVQVVLAENLYNKAFVKEQTDLTLLVREDNNKLLRQSDLEPDGNDSIFYWWDEKTNRAVPAPGSTGSEHKTIALGNVDPALEGKFNVAGIDVRPAFEHMRSEAMKFPPESTHAITGVHPNIVREEARHLAKAKKAILLGGFGIGKFTNGIYTGWAQSLLSALTGHGGPTGGIDTSYTFWAQPAFFSLMYGFEKPPRLEAGGMAEFLRGDMMELVRGHFDPAKLKEIAGFDFEELEEMVQESVDKGWMPYYGEMKAMILVGDNKFRRNKGFAHYRERILAKTELFVDINVRMDSTAMWADYVLPASSHYEAWDLRTSNLQRFVSVFTAPAKPLGESKSDWAIMALLAKKIQERTRAQGIGTYQDGDVTRNLDTLYDDFTKNGELLTDYDVTNWLVTNSPEYGGISLDEAAERGFIVMNEKAAASHSRLRPDKPWGSYEKSVEEKLPYPTLSGRITFYVDHERFLRLNSRVPTARSHLGKDASKYPLNFYSPHTRWGIHSTWRTNKYLMRMQRGEPNVYLNPLLASKKHIKDGQMVRVFNNIGEFYAQAKLAPGVPPNAVMMEHGWEAYQFQEQKPLNSVTCTVLQPLELVGGWGHLSFQPFNWNANQSAHESGVDIALA